MKRSDEGEGADGAFGFGEGAVGARGGWHAYWRSDAGVVDALVVSVGLGKLRIFASPLFLSADRSRV